MSIKQLNKKTIYLGSATSSDGTGGGGGGSGTTNYNALTNKPSINGIVLTGNHTGEQLKLADKDTVDMLDNEIDTLSKDYVSLSKTTTQTIKSPLSLTNAMLINGDTNAFKIEVNETGSALLNSNDLTFDKLPKTNDTTSYSDLADNQFITKKIFKEQGGGSGGGDIDPSLIDTKIAEHNLSDQSHSDIRNNIKNILTALPAKANLASTATEQIGNIAIIDKDGQYETSDTKLSDINDDIDILNQQIGTFVSTAKDAALKSQPNTFTGGNTFSGGVVLDTNPIHLTNGASIKNGSNDKAILNTITIDDNTEQTYLGGDKVWLKGPDEILLEGTTIKTKRGTSPDNWIEYTNIDTGNISNYLPDTATGHKYGIEADYAVHYGILDCPNGLIETSILNKDIEIQPGIILQLAGNNGKTTIGSKTTYTIEESGELVLFLAKTSETQIGFLEAGDVYYQEEEPTNGTTSYLAWWKPSIKKWQFKSVVTGNVWREAIATPVANIKINESNTGVMSINYIGYRIIDDDIFPQMNDIESIQDTIQTINTNVSTLDTTVNAYGVLINQTRQDIIELRSEMGDIPAVLDAINGE